MDLKAKSLLKVLLSNNPYYDQLLRFLPAHLAKEIQTLALVNTFDPPLFFSTRNWVKQIHFSWLTEEIKDFPLVIQSLFLNLFDADQVQGIQQMLHLRGVERPVSRFVKPFLIQILLSILQGDEILSEQLLPSSLLNSLLKLDRKSLLHTMDLLGIHDLAADLRQVVDKELLKRVQTVLSPNQFNFLQYASKQPIKWVPKKLGLMGWDGSKRQLSHLLHYRGLIRFAKGIANENSSLKWYLLHKLDTGRAKIIEKELHRKQDPTLIPLFKNQILHIAKRYKT